MGGGGRGRGEGTATLKPVEGLNLRLPVYFTSALGTWPYRLILQYSWKSREPNEICSLVVV